MQRKIKSKSVEKWGIFEITLHSLYDGNPFTDVGITCEFKYKNRTIEVEGFYDGDNIYKFRFMPDKEGKWIFKTKSNIDELNNITGEFECVEPSNDNHGPVRVKNIFHFAYEDGTKYIPVGTTCYAWIHQDMNLQEKTLETLKNSPFNKLRMCIFPKWYDFNRKEPIMYPYEKKENGEWDFKKFNVDFFKHLDKRIEDLMKLGIEADLILFHPYDKWGFSNMGKENDDLYVKYVVNRFSAFRNVWWSLANEYDLLEMHRFKEPNDWDRFAKIIMENDPYGHLRSIHNCFRFYDFTKSWVTHCSMQRIDVYKTSEFTDEWRKQYNKPIVIDECAYEGNINHGWGNIPGEELVRRLWEGFVRGGYVGHGETYMHPEDILWWSHGGELHGTSPKRIEFLKRIIENAPIEGVNPIYNPKNWDVICGGKEHKYYLFYFGNSQPSFRIFEMPEDIEFKVQIIDTWEMTIKELEGIYKGTFKIELPAKRYIAVKLQAINERY